MSALMPEEEITAKLPAFREGFEDKWKANFDSGKYDARDVERLRTDDAYAKCYIRSFEEKGEIKNAIENVDSVLTFRKEMQINDLKDDSFPADFAERNFLYWKGENKLGNKILYFTVVKHKKGKQVEEVKKYIAYYFDQYQKAHVGERIVLIFDFTGAGVTNMDMDVVKYIISCFADYFPSLLHQILLFEMPMLLSAAWKIIQTWLSAEQKKKIVLVKKKDILEFIDPEQLEPHMVKK